MSALTRGPLPARVYWVRRVLLVALLTGLVVGSVQLVQLAAGLGGSDPDQAAPMAAEPSEDVTSDVAPPGVSAPAEQVVRDRGEQKQRKKRQKRSEPVLAEPEGPCEDSDIAVTPVVDEAVGGSPIKIGLELRSISSPACTWRVSPDSVTVKVTSGKDDIWSSLECPRAVPRKDVVVRQDVSTRVDVTWSARRSDEGCTRNTQWALPGWYFVDAAALAGEPSDLHFEVTRPQPKVVTKTVEPKPEKKKSRERDQDD